MWSRQLLGAKAVLASSLLANAEASFQLGEYAAAGALSARAVEALEPVFLRAKQLRWLAEALRQEEASKPPARPAPGGQPAASEAKSKSKSRAARRSARRKRAVSAAEASATEAAQAPTPVAPEEEAQVEKWRDRRARNRWEVLMSDDDGGTEPEETPPAVRKLRTLKPQSAARQARAAPAGAEEPPPPAPSGAEALQVQRSHCGAAEVGSLLQVRPGEELVVDDVEYFVAGDVGTVLKFYVDQRHLQRRFSIRMHRTGMLTTVAEATWQKRFRILDPLAEPDVDCGAAQQLDGRDLEGGRPGCRLEMKRAVGKLQGFEPLPGSKEGATPFYETWEGEWLMLGHSVHGEMFLLKEGPLVRRAKRWRHIWEGRGAGEDRCLCRGIFLPVPDDPDFVACGTIFVCEAQNLREPRADFPLALVHRSLVEPTSQKADLGSVGIGDGQRFVSLQLVPGLNTFWPCPAPELRELPTAHVLKPAVARQQPAPQQGAPPLLCVRNTFLDLRAEPAAGAQQRRPHSWPPSPSEAPACPPAEEAESEEDEGPPPGPPARAPAGPAGRSTTADAVAVRGPATPAQARAAMRTPYEALLPYLGPAEARRLRAASRQMLRWAKPLPFQPAAAQLATSRPHCFGSVGWPAGLAIVYPGVWCGAAPTAPHHCAPRGRAPSAPGRRSQASRSPCRSRRKGLAVRMGRAGCS